jgi:hypothetical protein
MWMLRSFAETPPGHESRLTKAMKAYHLEKARDPSDLPEWLFDESERYPGRRARTGRDDVGRYAEEAPEAPRGRGFRDIYDAAASKSAPRARSTPRGYEAGPAPRSRDYSPPRSSMKDAYADDAGGTKASNRLKAMRDAKRQAAARNAGASVGRVEDELGGSRAGRGRMSDAGSSSAPAPPRARVGLPSGPGVRPRRV